MGESTRVLCLGEALVDVVIRGEQREEHVGGSLLNVACGIASLGRPASICAWWGPDARGEALAEWAGSAGVEIVPGTDSAEKTAVAYATLDEEGRASYEFDLEWHVPQMDDLTPYGHVQTGSIAATLEPGGTRVVEVVKGVREHGTVSYDPNIRPALMGSPDAVVGRIEELVALSDLVKVSDEDLGWLFGEEPVEDVMRRWLDSGPSMVVVTRGPWGAYAVLRGERDLLHIDQMYVDLADTVGAGDSFMAGLVSGLHDAGLLGSLEARKKLAAARWGDVIPALHRAVVTSGITVSKHGAYAPSMDEVRAVQEADPQLA